MYPFLCNGCGQELKISEVWYDSFKDGQIEKSLIYDFLNEIENNLKGNKRPGNTVLRDIEHSFITPEEEDLSFLDRFDNKHDNENIFGKKEKKFKVTIADDDFYDADNNSNTDLPFEIKEFMVALYKAEPKLFRIKPDFGSRKAIIEIKGEDLYTNGEPISGLSRAYVEYLANNKASIECKLIFKHEFGADFDEESQRLTTVLRGYGRAAFTPVARCPMCKAKLSGDFGKYQEIRIGVLGTERQGKSAVLTATYSTFKNGYGNVTIWDTVAGQGDSSISTFGKDYLSRYEKNISIKKTETSDTLAYRFSISHGSKKYNLLFVDIAGELLFDKLGGHLISDEFHRKYRSFIEKINCVWFCIDNSVIDKATAVPLGLGLGKTGMVGGTLTPADCKSLVSSLRAFNKNVPWIVLAVKSDMMNQEFIASIRQKFGNTDGHGRIITRNNWFDEEKFLALSETVRSFIESKNDKLPEALEDSGKLGYSLCSAYGHSVNSFNVAFSGNETVIFVPSGVESVFPQAGKEYSVKVYLGDHLAVGMMPKFEDSSVKADQCTYHNGLLDFDGNSAVALRIGFCLEHDTDYVAVVECDGTRNMYSLKREERYSSRININFNDGNPLKEFNSLLKPEPWLMEVPLLWTLAVQGNYRTVGTQSYKRHWPLRQPPDSRETFINDPYSKKILRGETDTHVHPPID